MGVAQFGIDRKVVEELLNLPSDARLMAIHSGLNDMVFVTVETPKIKDDGRIHRVRPVLQWDWSHYEE